MTKKLEAHPYAELFPMMDALELDALTDDIRENGLKQPLVLYEGKVLDGRNRLLACQKAKVEPTCTDYTGDDDGALALALSLNVQRRDLTAGQRAIVAARAIKKMPERRGGDRRSASAKSGDQKAKNGQFDPASEFKVNKTYIQQAKTLLDKAPDLADEVSLKRLNITEAHRQYQQREEDNKRKAEEDEKAERRKERESRLVAKYMEAISNGEMTMAEALQKVMEEEREERERAAAEADARRNWLKEYAQALEWFERFVSQRTDEDLIFYTIPDSPGLFEHGITPERIAAVISQLERSCNITFGVQTHDPREQAKGTKKGSRSA